jgi:hypothetical protein
VLMALLEFVRVFFREATGSPDMVVGLTRCDG